MTATGLKLEGSKSVVPSPQEITKTTKPEDARVVSFRDDVVFEHTGRSNMSVSSHSSKTSETETSGSKYSKLRSSLTQQRTNRNPLFSYQVTRHLGSGSMGDVKLVKKRQEKLGGSARRDWQTNNKDDCYHLFQYCINSGGETSDRGLSSPRSVLSIFSALEDSKVSSARSFEDSLVNKVSPPKDIIYAMKSILLDQMTEQVFIDELRQEIAVLKHLDHPNIVRAIETFEFEGMISLVMELCSGGDLYVRDPYSEADAARIVSSILSAIAYMHSQNVVHRDLKFENVLFVNTSPMSDVKLIDFGLSRVYGGGQKLTDISGTIYTIAPEVLKNNHTEKADMWSIGTYNKPST
jgi:serine/threonine protein kinase